MLDESLYGLYVSSNMFHPTCNSVHSFIRCQIKDGTDMLLPVILSELIDFDDEKQHQGKTREWIKRRHHLGSFQNIIKELIVEDQYTFKGMFQLIVEDFETVFKAYQ